MKRLHRTSLKGRLLAGAVAPVALGVGLALTAAPQPAAAKNPTAVPRPPVAKAGTPLPIAVARPVQIAACGACGAKKGACGACGAKKGGACGACGAGNPCGPCGGGGAVSKTCVVPRLAAANPCAAKKSGACSACGAKKAGACGACGAKKAGACGACGAKKAGACGACGACGGAKPAAKLTDSEAAKAYGCLLRELRAAYGKSGHKAAKSYAKWKRYNTVPYVSETHGNRYVNNYANAKARNYIKFDKVKSLPAGSVLAKDSFQAMADGKLAYGPLFLMTKMRRGWSKASGDWKYAMVMPDGTLLGTTRGKGADKVKFCYQCHMAAADKDSLFFLPEKYRVRR
ncbi:MAG: cytochrome P460 family protein [Alphaproteobacteria bacterium]